MHRSGPPIPLIDILFLYSNFFLTNLAVRDSFPFLSPSSLEDKAGRNRIIKVYFITNKKIEKI